MDNNRGTSLPYLRIDENIYAVDTENVYYNKIGDVSTGFPEEGEHMLEYSPQYNYGLSLDYNIDCEYGKRSNIFFHCKWVKRYTGGCVTINEDMMKMILQKISPSDRICIYSL